MSSGWEVPWIPGEREHAEGKHVVQLDIKLAAKERDSVPRTRTRTRIRNQHNTT